MKYMIEFDLPDNDTVLREIKTADVAWGIWGYRGYTKAKPVQRWIPCSERCPEQSGWYLVSLKNGNVQKAWYRVAPINQGGSYWRSPIKRPLAWMPLPEPWKGGQDEAEQ